MSDSFADLWNSSTPAKPAPRKLGSSTSFQQQQPVRKPQNDVFSVLAGGSAGNSRSGSPAVSLNSRNGTPNMPSYSRASSGQPATAQPGSNGQARAATGGDAFSGLGFGSTSSSTTNLTMAERQSLQQQQQLRAYAASLSAPSSTSQISSAWEGLDSLGSSSLAPSKASSQAAEDEDWGLGDDFTKRKPASSSQAKPQPGPVDDDGWGGLERGIGARGGGLLSLEDDNDDFMAAPATPKTQPGRKQRPQQPPKNLWDLDEFISQPQDRQRTDSPSQDFDFGDRENGDNDDILGELGRPASSSPAPRAQPARPSSNNSRSTSVRSNNSPPPHLLGQLVEMGFPVQDAKHALASTDGGADVEAAVAILAASASDRQSRPTPPLRPREQRSRQNTQTSQTSRQDSSPIPSIQTDQILAQASVFGKTFLNRANAMWKEGKEKAQKIYEEYNVENQAGSSSGRSSAANGRPKWMQEAGDFKDDEGESQPKTPKSAFRDESDNPPQPPARPTASRPAQSASAAPELAPEPEVDLFAPAPVPAPAAAPPTQSSEPRVYQSRFRNAEASSRSTPRPSSAPSRPSVQATPAQQSASETHKQRGNTSFKLGQYADAESAYTLAIGALPAGCWVLLVPLHNNRALARLKTGDYKGAEADATVVIDESGGSGEDAKKAIRRRAEALEGREKWAEARKDWERLGDAVGVGRCRKMMEPQQPRPSSASSVPRATPSSAPKRAPARPAPLTVKQSGEALRKLQEQNAAASNEDAQRFALKDTVDAKLAKWKQGKENNIRGLLAALHSDLGIGEEGLGMKDLITEKQVKIRYTKSIARVHPDKMNERNSTLEQRMIANGVFGTLNEAWNVFKP